jgi:predicted glycosyltransferase
MSLRVLIAVTHLLGVGHLTRAAALARAFAQAGHKTVLVSGGMPAPLVRTDGAEVVQLPPVRTTGTDFKTLLDENGLPATPSRFEARRDMLMELIEHGPDVVVTELFPFGRRALAGEFMTLLKQAKAARSDTLVLASIRDVLVAPAKPDRIATTHEILRSFYDAVLVHGDPELAPIEASWPLDESARALVRYTGYVDDGAAVDGTVRHDEIIVSGGGSAASLPLFRAAMTAADIIAERPWRILVGTGVEEADFAELRQAAPPHVMVERARPDFRNLLAGAAVSVSQAGYNTAVDVLRAGARAVFVPFEQGNETEQRLRAERLAAHGAAEVVPEADLSPALLAERVRAVLRRPRPASLAVNLDGAARSVAIVEEIAAKRFGSGRHARKSPPASPWGALEEALRRASDRQTPIPVWWRDDDAIVHTLQLDRLLELARRLHIPIAIAAVPAHVESSLMARLVEEPLVRVLVHGLAHANHAPGDAKKAEFGPHRPPGQLAQDAERGLRLAHGCFGDLLVPVFVPPWNRIAPELVELLPGLGYSGLSTFGERPRREPVPGLLQVNTHIDPIAWHGGRSLRDAEALVPEVARAVAARVGSDGRDPEPIGLLTHHHVHDEAVWAFCEELLSRLAEHSIVRFVNLDAMFVGAQTCAA